MRDPDIDAAALKPFVSEANLWIVQNHGLLQGHNFFLHMVLDRSMRGMFKDHPYRDRAAEFVEGYGNPAFDPAMGALSLSHFEPMLRRLIAAPKNHELSRMTCSGVFDGVN